MAWQFRQANDAIKKLFGLAGLSCRCQVGGGHWGESARGLTATHPTVSWDNLPLPGGDNPGAGLASGEEKALVRR